MKKSKKIMALCLALALVFSSTANVFAYQLGDDEYSGIQVNDTFYSAQYIIGNKAAFGNVFGHANANNVILDFNGFASRFSDYLAANPADYDTWAGTHGTPSNPAKLVKPDGTTVDCVEDEELTVESVVALNRTTIEVEFSDGVTKIFTGYNLVSGLNTVEFTYEGIEFEKQVRYTPSEATVDKVEFVDYRHMKVTFSTLVDEATAADPANYYFELVEGNAEYSAAVIDPALMWISNQLENIDTDYAFNYLDEDNLPQVAHGAAAWWYGYYNKNLDILFAPPHIVADEVNGKTVVDIYLPEDSRFTNELDITTGGDDDDERTIIANVSNLADVPLSNTKAMIKERTVNVGVRNVRDIDGERSIDSEVLPMLILDETAPEFVDFWVVPGTHTPDTPTEEPREVNTAASRPVVTITSDGEEDVALEFNEPVFNAHDLGVDDINNNTEYNVAVYVDTIRVGEREERDLWQVLKFDMSKDGTYDDSRFAVLDVEKAVNIAYQNDQKFRGCGDFRISVVGIPDLAGNTQVPNPIEFTAKVVDPEPNNPSDVIPEVLDVVQIHDNVFRVMFNRNDITAKFEIDSADGEDGLIEKPINGALIPVDEDKDLVYEYYYADVYVPALDIEDPDGINIENDGILAYDDGKTLSRKVRVFDVKVVSEGLSGETWCRPLFTITKDIYAPTFIQPDDIEYEDRDGKIRISMKDQVPESWLEVGQPVYAMLYDYNYHRQDGNNVFDPTINVEATEDYNNDEVKPGCEADLLPIKVYFDDKEGNTHAVLVSNKKLTEDFSWRWVSALFKAGWNDGYPGAITYDADSCELILDLSKYSQLTDGHGNLFPGVTYNIELPDGYFADPAKFDANDDDITDQDGDGIEGIDVQYVSAGRQNNEIGDAESYIVRGYVADEMKVLVDVLDAEEEPVDDAVPQTSKYLINYAQDANEIWVEFTGQVKKSTLEDADHFMVNGKTLKELGLDDSTVKYVSQITDAFRPYIPDCIWDDIEENMEERQFAQIKLGYDTIPISGDYTFEVFGVTNDAGGEMVPVSTRIDLIENTRPVVEETSISANDQIVLRFDEALMYGDDVDEDEINAGFAAAENFEVIINDGAPITPVTAVLSDSDHRTVTLTVTGVDFYAADSIVVNIVEDQNDQMNLEDISDNHNPIKADEVEVK